MIGFYDSGIGGLSILEEVLKLDPSFKYVYFADLEILPLGEKSIDFIQNRVKRACEFLFENGCEIVVLACNTASVNSIRHIQQVWLPQNYSKNYSNKDRKYQVLSITKPFTEMLESKYSNLKNKNGLILSTKATQSSGFYQYEFLNLGFKNLKSIACNGLADAIEIGNDLEVEKLLESYIFENKLETKNIEYILLACTHYKYTMDQIQKHFENSLILEPSKTVAEKLFLYLKNHPEFTITQSNSRLYSTSKNLAVNPNLNFSHQLPNVEFIIL